MLTIIARYFLRCTKRTPYKNHVARLHKKRSATLKSEIKTCNGAHDIPNIRKVRIITCHSIVFSCFFSEEVTNEVALFIIPSCSPLFVCIKRDLPCHFACEGVVMKDINSGFGSIVTCSNGFWRWCWCCKLNNFQCKESNLANEKQTIGHPRNRNF